MIVLALIGAAFVAVWVVSEAWRSHKREQARRWS